MLKLNLERIEALAGEVRRLAEGFKWESFTSPEYYPPRDEDEESVARYFFFMVSIDHRTHPPEVPWEGDVEGRLYSGSDLLYRLGSLKYLKDRTFFSPEHMSTITLEEVREWLTYRGRLKEPAGLELRWLLLRDAGRKLERFYGGSVMLLLRESGGVVGDGREGLLALLKAFVAYNDPVEKKAFLLVKFLERRGLLEVKDPHNLHVPVDNHLVRLALRTGIVEPCASLPEAEVSREEDVAIRSLIRRAYKVLSDLSGLRPTYLDDIVWAVGKRCCKWERPLCEECADLRRGGCPLKNVCKGRYDEHARSLREHRFLNTWYY